MKRYTTSREAATDNDSSNLVMDLDALHSGLYHKNYRNTVYHKTDFAFYGVAFINPFLAIQFSSLFFYATGTHNNYCAIVK